MRVSDLIERLSKANPDAVVVVSVPDHRYREIEFASETDAETDRSGDLWEAATDDDSNVTILVLE
jgi:hypothetical protein